MTRIALPIEASAVNMPPLPGEPAHHARSVSRMRLRQFVARAAAAVPAGGRVLDAGAGDCRHRSLFTGASYESADFCAVDKPYSAVTYRCDLRSIPVEDARFDLVLMTQVLEHLPEPHDVLREINRVLKPHGQLWLSAPLYYQEHERPYDFYRYTQDGLRYLLQKSGFEMTELQWLEGYFATLAHQLRQACAALPSRPRDFGGGAVGWLAAGVVCTVRPAFAALSHLFNRLERRHRYTAAGHCKNYCVIATKTGRDQH